jgi:putative transcriptional regulator
LEKQRLLPGSLLISHPLMKTNLFSNSVVLIIESYNRIYKGLIVNKKSPYCVGDVVDDCKKSYTGQTTLYKGGPVNPSALIMLHSDDWYSTNTMQLGNALAISSDLEMIEKLAVDNSPFNYKVIAGISQWSDLQLKNELAATNERTPYWLMLDNYDPKLLFDTECDLIWETAIDLYSQNMFDRYF